MNWRQWPSYEWEVHTEEVSLSVSYPHGDHFGCGKAGRVLTPADKFMGQRVRKRPRVS